MIFSFLFSFFPLPKLCSMNAAMKLQTQCQFYYITGIYSKNLTKLCISGFWTASEVVELEFVVLFRSSSIQCPSLTTIMVALPTLLKGFRISF